MARRKVAVFARCKTALLLRRKIATVVIAAWATVIEAAAVCVAALRRWAPLEVTAAITAKIAVTTTGIKTAASRLAASIAATTRISAKVAAWAAPVITATKVTAWAVRRGCKALLRLEASNHAGFEVLLRVVLNVLNLAAVAKLCNRDGIAFTASTACASNAVHIILSLHWQAVVDHVGNRGHVQAASSNVGCHQHLYTTVAESHQAAVAQTLAQRTVQCHSAKAVLHQIIGQAVAFNLSAGKHDRLVDRGVAQQVVEQLALVRHVVSPVQ